MTGTSERPPDDGMTRGVPRVLEVPALASLDLEPLDHCGLPIEGRSSTGFVVTNTEHQPFLITSRQAVTGRSGGMVASVVRVLMNGYPFGTWVPVVFRLGDEDGRPTWLEHPVHGAAVDVIAIPVDQYAKEEVDLISYQVKGSALPRLDIASELYVIGFPVGFDSLRANAALGVWSRGTIAWPPALDWEGLPRMLIDFRSRRGQIGSPVVFYADEMQTFRASDGQLRTGREWDLVGLFGGSTQEGDVTLGVVWKRSVIDGIIESGQPPADPAVPPLDPNIDLAQLTTLPEP